MNEVHIVMTSKGGVGKSWIAFLLSQFLKQRSAGTRCIDADSQTPTLFRYEALKVQFLQIADQKKVDLARFDELVEMIAGTTEDFVIDTGSGTFLPISQYMLDYDIFSLLVNDYKKTVVIHAVLNARRDNDLLATTACIDAIAREFPNTVKLVVWMNAFGGPIVTQDGIAFEDTELYHDIKHRIAAIIDITNPDELTERDIKAMVDARFTFDEALASAQFRIVSKSRLSRVKKTIFDQITMLAPAWAAESIELPRLAPAESEAAP